VWSGGNSIVSIEKFIVYTKKAIHIISRKHWREHTASLFAKLRTHKRSSNSDFGVTMSEMYSSAVVRPTMECMMTQCLYVMCH